MLEIEKIKKTKRTFQPFAWDNYQFGKNFFECVIRNEAETKKETDFIIQKIKPQKKGKILDLGCGGGRNAKALAENGFFVTGIDLNLYAIEQAIRQNGDQKNLNFFHQDLQEINYEQEFDLIMMIFHHFSIFNKIEAKKIMGKLSQALNSQGKLFIEIPSVSQGRNLDNYQEWFVTEQWLSGKFKQLVLVENEFSEKEQQHFRTDYCINALTGEVSFYQQRFQLYEPEEIEQILKLFDFRVLNIFGDWSGKRFSENDDLMLILAQKA